LYERLALRLKEMGNPRYTNGFRLTLHPDQLDLPLRWGKSKMIFVNSMSDLFHEAIPDDYIKKVFATMVKADWHIFQILTKRAERLAKLAPQLPWPSHVWQGVSRGRALSFGRTSFGTDQQAAIEWCPLGNCRW
jgi:protein gp37